VYEEAQHSRTREKSAIWRKDKEKSGKTDRLKAVRRNLRRLLLHDGREIRVLDGGVELAQLREVP